MVTSFGMSDKLGPRTFGKREELVFLGKEISEQRDYSDKIAEAIDEEVHAFVDSAYAAAKDILLENKSILMRLFELLMEKETIEGDELKQIFDSDPPPLAESA